MSLLLRVTCMAVVCLRVSCSLCSVANVSQAVVTLCVLWKGIINTGWDTRLATGDMFLVFVDKAMFYSLKCIQYM